MKNLSDYDDNVIVLNYKSPVILDRDKLSNELDRLGDLSAEAQLLKVQITHSVKLKENPSHTVLAFINGDRSKMLGYIKYGEKDLYFYRKSGEVVNKKTLCVLDFFVDIPYQRKGIGKILFDNLLKLTSTSPDEIAYDRPSDKLLAFLKKNYEMKEANIQPNKFAIFDTFIL